MPASDSRAHQAVANAIKRGQLVRPETCEKCGRDPGKARDGRSRIHAHHPDYNKPLEVVWLCPTCHHHEPAGIRREGKHQVGVGLRIEETLLAQIDAARGLVSRSAWIHDACWKAVGRAESARSDLEPEEVVAPVALPSVSLQRYAPKPFVAPRPKQKCR